MNIIKLDVKDFVHEMRDDLNRIVNLFQVKISRASLFDDELMGEIRTFYVIAEDKEGAGLQASSGLWGERGKPPDGVIVEITQLPLTVRGWGKNTF